MAPAFFIYFAALPAALSLRGINGGPRAFPVLPYLDALLRPASYSPPLPAQASESRISLSVRQLDLRSVQASGADKKRMMLSERKSAMMAMSSVPHPVSPPGVRPASASASGGRVAIRSPHMGEGGGSDMGSVGRAMGRSSAHEEAHAAALEAAEKAGAAALQKVAVLEESLARTCAQFAGYVGATETPASPYYTVSFAAGPIGACWGTSWLGGEGLFSRMLSPKWQLTHPSSLSLNRHDFVHSPL